ncbi:MAG: PHP domain-containing protein [Anaerolineales bacterium]|nr:PHP domain-containing protein [Anaerolineales bacterium]
MTLSRKLTLEFHCHTHASKDSLTRPEDLVRVARRKGLDRLVITDHNSIAGARAAQHWTRNWSSWVRRS